MGSPSGNCSAAAASGTFQRLQTASIFATRSRIARPRRLVIVHRAGDRAGRENPGIVDAADDDPDPALGASRKFLVEHLRSSSV